MNNRLRNTLLILLIFICTALPVFAETEVITIDNAVELALQNSISMKISERKLNYARSVKDTFWNNFLPQVSVNGTLARMNETPVIMGISAPEWGVSVGFSASLRLNVGLIQGIEYSILSYEAGVIDHEKTRQAIARDTKKLFYNLLVMKESLILFEDNIKTAERRYERARLNYEDGAASEFQMLSARVSYENMKPVYKDIENGYNISLLSFKHLLGIDSGKDIEISGSIEIEPTAFDTDTLIQKYISNRLDIQYLTKNIKVLQKSREGVQLLNWTPSVILNYSMDPSFTKDPFAANWFADIENDWVQRSGMFGITIAMRLDGFLPGSSTQMEIQKMVEQEEQLILSLSKALQGAELEINSIVLNLEKSFDSLEILELNVGLAQKAFDLAEEGYQEGARELLEVQNAENEFKKAKLEVLKEQYNYIAGIIDLEYAINTNLSSVIKE